MRTSEGMASDTRTHPDVDDVVCGAVADEHGGAAVALVHRLARKVVPVVRQVPGRTFNTHTYIHTYIGNQKAKKKK